MDFQATSMQAQRALEEGRIRAAKLLYERLIAAFPPHGIVLHYNLGCLYRSCVGSGTKARYSFQRALEAPPPTDAHVNSEIISTIRANATENLMLLSLSFDEFDTCAERLAQLQPNNPILTKHRANVQSRHEQGASWCQEMMQQANSYFRADPSQDPGLYAEAAATFELILTNRETLRVPRTDYRIATIGYAGLVMKTCAKFGMTMERNFGAAHDPEEVLFIAEQALPLIQEYIRVDPEDARVRQSAEVITQYIKNCRTHNAVTPRILPAAPRLPIAFQWLILAVSFITILLLGLVKACRP